MKTHSPQRHASAASPAAVVLVIGGSDNSAGAGIQADIKTGGAIGAYVVSVITAITAQNADSVSAVHALTPDQVREQWFSLQSFPIKAIKLGMLPNAELATCVAELLQSAELPIVMDPVLSITAGHQMKGELRDIYLQSLLPLASVLTPNLSEAATLLESKQAFTYEEMEVQARALHQLGPETVLIKGGHLEHALATDVLVSADALYPFSAPRVDTTHTHGGGCTLATAIACGIAQKLSIRQAVAAAKTYMQGAAETSGRLQLAAENGPIHHFYTYW